MIQCIVVKEFQFGDPADLCFNAGGKLLFYFPLLFFNFFQCCLTVPRIKYGKLDTCFQEIGSDLDRRHGYHTAIDHR